MFLENQEQKQKDSYRQLLKSVASLSGLFSQSDKPYIAPRVAETVFCHAFTAEDLSRSDISVDARKEDVGIGIKTFLHGNGKTWQKIAEFNSEHGLFDRLAPENKIQKISELRNKRILATKDILGIDNFIYHCITRDTEKISLFEEDLNEIILNRIKAVKHNENIIRFEDSRAEYSFNVTKSTLYKRFYTEKPLLEFDARIIKDPFEALEKILSLPADKLVFSPLRESEHVFLPLYSTRKEKNVPKRSGLNQWNAKGRPRHPNEVYIPIPAWIHSKFPGFFPLRDTNFDLLLPDRRKLKAKVCQENSKALMSDPNQALGEWILRKILKLKAGELVTYEKLEEIGLDSVVVYKINESTYDIDFTKIGSYKEFEQNNL